MVGRVGHCIGTVMFSAGLTNAYDVKQELIVAAGY